MTIECMDNSFRIGILMIAQEPVYAWYQRCLAVRQSYVVFSGGYTVYNENIIKIRQNINLNFQ